MGRIVKIGKIEFNRQIVKYGEIQKEEAETFELGDKVESIVEMQTIDKWYCRIYFKGGTFQDIFNVSRVYWVEEG